MKRSKAETCERILEVARELLVEGPAHEVQLRDIATRAGVSASLIVQYFGSKEMLVFHTRIAQLKDLTSARFARFLEANAKFTLEDVFSEAFAADLNARAMIQDLLALSWLWPSEQEAKFQEAIDLRRRACEIAIARTYGGGPSDERCGIILDALCSIYLLVLRHAAQRDEAPAAAMRRFMTTAETLSVAWKPAAPAL